MGSMATHQGLDKEDAVEAEQLQYVRFIVFSRWLWESQSPCTPPRTKRGYMSSERCFDYSKHSSSTKQYMYRGNPGLCPQIWPCWHRGRFPRSISLAMNLVKTQMVSDCMQPLTLSSSQQCPASALSTWFVRCSCIIAFPSKGAASAKEGRLRGCCLGFHLF